MSMFPFLLLCLLLNNATASLLRTKEDINTDAIKEYLTSNEDYLKSTAELAINQVRNQRGRIGPISMPSVLLGGIVGDLNLPPTSPSPGRLEVKVMFSVIDPTAGSEDSETIQAAVARLEESHHRCQIVRTADAISDIITAARIGPAGIAFLVAARQLDDLGASFRPAARAATDVVGKPDLVKRHHMPRRPSETARAMSAATCVRDCRKLSASRAMMVTLTPPPP